jgi:predicted kinase
MLIGPPGCGKSTYIKDRVHSKDFYIASTDNIIIEFCKEKGITYDQGFKKFFKDAENRMKKEIIEAIRNDVSIIWDQTNLTVKSRVKKLEMIPDKYFKEAFYFIINEDELRRRLHYRAQKEGKTIPEHVLCSMLKNYEVPSSDEGFDVVNEITN